MEIEIMTFGKIGEFLKNQQLDLDGVGSTDQLSAYLEQMYPELGTMKYKLAVNKTLTQKNTLLKNGDLVAIMPPFSGG
jgi:molybdopterin synthase sulfur carrier subunit